MTHFRLRTGTIILATITCAGGYVTPWAQTPTAPPVAAAAAQGGGGRGRGGGLPGATPQQLQAVADMGTALSALTAAVAAARGELATATFSEPPNAEATAAAIEKVRAAELALALGRAAEFAKLQAGPSRLNAEQIAALIAAGGTVAAGRGNAPAPAVAAPAATGRAGRGN